MMMMMMMTKYDDDIIDEDDYYDDDSKQTESWQATEIAHLWILATNIFLNDDE